MAKVNGIDAFIKYGDDQFPIICGRSIQFDISRDMIETSISGSGYYRTYVPGAIQWTGSMEGFVVIDTTQDGVLKQMYDYITNGTSFLVTWYEEDTTGTYYLQKSGTAYMNSISEVSSFDNMATFTLNFTGTGPITITSDEV